jgi:hypothetical protein
VATKIESPRWEEVTPRRVFLQLLMQEQGWRYRPEGAEQPSLRERLLGEVEIDENGIEKRVREDLKQQDQKKRTRAT